MTPIAVRQVSETYKLPGNPDMYDPTFNVKYAILLLDHYSKESRNVNELLASYNGGYRQRDRLRSGVGLAPETSKYLSIVGDRSRRLAGLDYRALRATPYFDLVERTFAELREQGYLGGLFQPRSTQDFNRLPADLSGYGATGTSTLQ